MADPRPQLLRRLQEQEVWDLLVIGGGATGLGTAFDAACRGLRVLLLEGKDFAKGTSSRATKLVHGGVRYLAQGNVHLVREALRERGRLEHNAPHLVNRLGFLLPLYQIWSGPFYGSGLRLYDLLAGSLSLGRTERIGPGRALELAPTLRRQGLRGAVRYFDGRFDDARLAVTLLRSLFDEGGLALNYFPVRELVKLGGRVSGVVAQDSETGQRHEIRARVVVNATGVFADAVRQLDRPDVSPLLSPSQGIHLVVDKEFWPSEDALMIPRTDDGRVMFAVPWHGRVLLGTTDTPVQQLSEEPAALPEEVELILKTASGYLEAAPQRRDVRSVFAGLRPLVKRGGEQSSGRISRDHLLFSSESGLITITGGKWTTYRHMAEQTVDLALKVGGLRYRTSPTADLRLHGAESSPGASVYGSDQAEVDQLGESPLLPGQPLREGQVRYAARQELARTVEDVLARRSRLLLLDAQASVAAAPQVARLLAEELGRDALWEEEQVSSFTALAQNYLIDPS